MLNGTSFRQKLYQRKNKTTLTSANLSKTVNNNANTLSKQLGFSV